MEDHNVDEPLFDADASNAVDLHTVSGSAPLASSPQFAAQAPVHDDTVYEPFLPTHFGLPEHPPRGHVRVFYSIDPTRGTIDVYPKRFCRVINDAINDSRGKSKGEVYLGQQFFDATVHWNHTEGVRWNGDGPRLYQTTPGGNVAGSWKSSGMRDVWVKDFELGGSRELVHQVQRVNYEWTGFIDQKLHEGEPTQRTATAQVPEEHFASDDDEEFLPRWQWCKRTNETMNLIPWEERTTGRASIFNVLEKDWGFYTDEVDQQIQAAHAAGEPHVDVVLCSRQYRIMFEPNSIYAKQVDPIMRKERVARLVYMKPSVIQQRMAGEACIMSDDQVCPICLLQFRDTPTIQAFALPCGHQFHGMCIQNEADKNHKCPYCRFDLIVPFCPLKFYILISLNKILCSLICAIRSEVDWASLFATYGNSVGNSSRRGDVPF
jgi:hypothetical protein